MGFFDFDWVYKPVRGIGRLLRGKGQEGLHDLTSSARDFAPAAAWIPGVGPLAAGAMGALGSLGEEITDKEKGVSMGEVLMSGASGFGSGKLAQAAGGASGVLDAVKGGAKGIGDIVGISGKEAAQPALTNAGSIGTTFKGVSSVAPKVAESAAAMAGGEAAMKGGMDALTKIALGTNIAGTAANVYGAHQMGAAEDRRMSLEEEELMRRRDRQESLDPVRAQLLQQLLASLNRPSAASV